MSVKEAHLLRSVSVPLLPGEVGEVLQPPAVLQVQSGLRGAQRRAGGLPSPRPLVPHRQPEERGHAGKTSSYQVFFPSSLFLWAFIHIH